MQARPSGEPGTHFGHEVPMSIRRVMQHIGVLGTGTVGSTVATRLVAQGYSVMMGSRTADNAKGATWARDSGARARVGTYADAAGFAELIFNCTRGDSSLEALESAGGEEGSGEVSDVGESTRCFGERAVVDEHVVGAEVDQAVVVAAAEGGVVVVDGE